MPESSVGVARQYAAATFQLAAERNCVERWLEELRTVAGAIAAPGIGHTLASPVVAEADKFAALRISMQGIDPLVLNLLFLLIRRRRINLIGIIAAAFARLVDERRGIVLAEVTTAVPLGEQERVQVARRLATALGGKQVQMRLAVDPRIIGGLVVRVGDKLINGSVAGRLESLRRELA